MNFLFVIKIFFTLKDHSWQDGNTGIHSTWTWVPKTLLVHHSGANWGHLSSFFDGYIIVFFIKLLSIRNSSIFLRLHTLPFRQTNMNRCKDLVPGASRYHPNNRYIQHHKYNFRIRLHHQLFFLWFSKVIFKISHVFYPFLYFWFMETGL